MIRLAPESGEQPVLMIGCRSQLLRAARQLGRKAVVVGGPWEKAHAPEVLKNADVALFVDDPNKVDLILAALLRAELSSSVFAAVVPASDEYVGVAAVLSGLVTRVPVNPWLALRWRDKALQKQAVAVAGIRVSPVEVIEDIVEPPAELELQMPVVVKPATGAGGANVHVVEEPDDLVRVVQDITSRTSRRTFVVEKFATGTEYQIDAVIHGGRARFVSVAEYLVNPLEALRGSVLRVATVDPTDDPDLQERCEQLAQESATALQITDSVIHLEAFRDPDGGVRFGECGVRLGGCFTPEMVEAKYGVDLALVYLQLLVGEPISLDPRPVPGVRCRALLPTKPGTLLAAPTAADLRALPGVCVAEIQHPVGARLPPSTENAVTRLGEIVVAGADKEETSTVVDNVVEWFLDRVVVQPD